MDGISQLASLLKERDNPNNMGIQVGTVLEAFPNIRVALGEKIILDKTNLFFSAQVLNEYKTILEVEGANNVITTNNQTIIKEEDSQGNNCIQVKVKWTNELAKGDEVILIPTADNQKFYLIDKVVSYDAASNS